MPDIVHNPKSIEDVGCLWLCFVTGRKWEANVLLLPSHKCISSSLLHGQRSEGLKCHGDGSSKIQWLWLWQIMI
jgi:hypothetical protein